MDRLDDPFIALARPVAGADFAAFAERDVSAMPPDRTRPSPPINAAAVARLHGFDLLERPLIGGVAARPGEILSARSVVALRRAMVGSSVVLLFEGGDPGSPIIMGVIEAQPLDVVVAQPAPRVAIDADGERHLITAQREIVLRCGDASITLTRAGKVIIQGNYILSRSTGYNKIKGAAIDIN